MKFSGYVTAHFIAGNLSSQYNSTTITAPGVAAGLGDPFPGHFSQVLLIQGSDVSPDVFNGTGVPIKVGGFGGQGVGPGAVTIAPGATIPASSSPTRRTRFSIAI